MKNKYFSIIILLFLGILVMTSCIKEELGVGNIQQSENDKSGTWNKNKTFEVYYLTELKDKAVSDLSSVSTFFKQKGDLCSLGVVDRTDAQISGTKNNSSAQIAFETARFSSFSLNRIVNNNSNVKLEGTTILFNHKINSEQSYKLTNDCYIKHVNIQVSTTTDKPIQILVPFATVRFDSNEQIEIAANSVFRTMISNTKDILIIGTVKTSLLDKLENATKDLSNCSLTKITKNADTEFSVFMLGKKSWVLRETTKSSVSGDLNAYRLSIETSVE